MEGIKQFRLFLTDAWRCRRLRQSQPKLPGSGTAVTEIVPLL